MKQTPLTDQQKYNLYVGRPINTPDKMENSARTHELSHILQLFYTSMKDAVDNIYIEPAGAARAINIATTKIENLFK